MIVKGKVLYLDPNKTTWGERADAMMRGTVLAREKYTLVRDLDVELPDAYATAEVYDAKNGMRLDAAELTFMRLQAIESQVFDYSGKPMRSMSVGDLVIIDGHEYSVKPVGFELFKVPS